MAPVVVDAKIPWFLTSLPSGIASNFGTAVGKYIFNLFPSYSYQPRGFFTYLSTQKDFPFPNPCTLAWTNANTAYGQDYRAGVLQYAPLAGAKIVFDEPHTTNQKDYSDLVARAYATKPDIFAMCAQFGGDSVTIVRNMDAIGFKPKLLSNGSLKVPGVPDSLGKSAEGEYGDGFWNIDLVTPGNKDFVSLFQAVNKRDPTYGAAVSYSGMQNFEAGIAAAGSIDREKVAAALSTLRNNNTVCGVWSVDKQCSHIFQQVSNGVLHTIWPVEYASAKGKLTNP